MIIPSKRIVFPCLLFGLFCLSTAGCGGGAGKTKAKKDYGKPTWLKVDKSKLAPLSEYETTLEGGKVIVFDPEGWERLARGETKAPKGFKSVIAFKKGNATIMMTKSQESRDIPDIDEDNIEEFAEGAQQKFRTAVRMVKLGGLLGVYFSKPAADGQRLNKKLDRRIVATSINGQLFTYQLVADQGAIDNDLTNALFAVISKTKIEGMEGESPAEAVETAAAATTETKAAEETESIVAATKPVEPEVTPEVKPGIEGDGKEIRATEVAAVVPKEMKKTEPKKADAKKPAKKSDKKGSAKDILSELDALLN